MTAPADVASTAAEVANASWHAYRTRQVLADTPSDAMLELHEAYTHAFAKGAAWSFVETGKLAPAIAAIAELVDWLRSTATEPQVDLEQVRQAWRAVKEAIVERRPVIGALLDMDELLGLHSEEPR